MEIISKIQKVLRDIQSEKVEKISADLGKKSSQQ